MPSSIQSFPFPLFKAHSRSQIVAVSHSVRRHVAEKTNIKAVRFITNYLLPPPKKAVLAFLGIPLLTGEPPERPTEIVRKAEVDVRATLSRRLSRTLTDCGLPMPSSLMPSPGTRYWRFP